MNERVAIVAGFAAATLAVGLYASTHLHVSTDISHFLPENADPSLAQLSREITASSLTRTMILSIGGPTPEEAIAGARKVEKALASDPQLAALHGGPAAEFGQGAFDLLFAHRYQLSFDDPERAWLKTFSPEGIAAAASSLRNHLAGPTGMLLARLVDRDPLQRFPALVERLQAMNSAGLSVVDGHFLSRDGCCAIVFLETKDSPFDGSTQQPLLSAIDRAFAAANLAHGGKLALEESGVNRFSVDAERMVRNDIDRISVISTAALVLLLLLLFRSLRILLISFLPLGVGMVAAIGASAAVFGEIHGLTLAFGSTLIGVCIDYPLHFLNHHSLLPATTGPLGTRRRIAWALFLGALTTLAGFAGLSLASFPGMRELGVFATAGICAAFAATWWLLPALSANVPPRGELHQKLADLAARLVGAIQRSRRIPWLVPTAALLLVVAGAPFVRWKDDPSVFNKLDDKLLAEDERVRARVSRMDSGRLVLATGPDADAALLANDQVAAALSVAKGKGVLADFSSLHPLLFSRQLQERNDQAWRSGGRETSERFLQGVTTAGFTSNSFDHFLEERLLPGPSPLTLDEVLKSPLRQLAHPFVAELPSGIGIVTLLRGVKDPDALARALAEIHGAHYFDQEEFIGSTYAFYRRRTLQVVAGGLAAMIAILMFRYRRPRKILAAAVPSLLAPAATLACLGLLGITANLMHVMSLLFVVSAAEDYAVFLLESVAEPTFLRASAVSIVLCCFATVLGFGLLGFSEMPALRAIGITTGIGVALGLLLAPTALLFVRPAARAGTSNA